MKRINFLHRFQTTHYWHGDVQYDDVRIKLGGKIDRLSAILGFSTDLPAGSDFEDTSQPLTNHFMIISEEDVYRHYYYSFNQDSDLAELGAQ
jgi:hypothetical protein